MNKDISLIDCCDGFLFLGMICKKSWRVYMKLETADNDCAIALAGVYNVDQLKMESEFS